MIGAAAAPRPGDPVGAFLTVTYACEATWEYIGPSFVTSDWIYRAARLF